jgi:hypothetical protein
MHFVAILGSFWVTSGVFLGEPSMHFVAIIWEFFWVFWGVVLGHLGAVSGLSLAVSGK